MKQNCRLINQLWISINNLRKKNIIKNKLKNKNKLINKILFLQGLASRWERPPRRGAAAVRLPAAGDSAGLQGQSEPAGGEHAFEQVGNAAQSGDYDHPSAGTEILHMMALGCRDLISGLKM